MNSMSWPVRIIWFAVFAAAVILHTLGIQQPFLGNFAQHQTDYATVIQRWLETGIDPLQPVMRFLGNGENRLFYGDFPLNMTLIALICKATGWSIEFAGRGLSAVFFFLSVFPFTRLTQRLFRDNTLSRWALLFYLYSPLTLIYGQSFLLEISALCFGLFAYDAFFRWWENSKIPPLIASGLFFSLMLATRIYFAPLLIPVGILCCLRFRWKVLITFPVYLLFGLALFLPVLWQAYAGHQAGLAGHESSLSDNLRVFMFNDPVFRKAFSDPHYYLPILKILIAKIVTPIGFILALWGMFFSLKPYRKAGRFLGLLLLSFLPLFLLAPRKFIEFEYYYLPLVPAFALWAAFGVISVMQKGDLGQKSAGVAMAALVLLSVRFSIAPVLIIPDEDRAVLQAAETVRAMTPPGARVIASHGSSSSFLYYTNRDGWEFHLPEQGIQAVRNVQDHEGTAVDRLERFRSQGAAYFALADKRQISQNPSFFAYLSGQYRLIYESKDSLIYSLSEPA